MREAHPVERAVGMRFYVSDADGIGGRLRAAPEDFRVREIEAFDVEPVDADPAAYPNLVCRVTLRDWDTNDFARVLSDRLGISRERVSWAGTKDKRAVTTQLVSVDGVEPAALPDLDGVDLTVVGRGGRAVLFGDLAGNAFEVVVHDPTAPDRLAAISDGLASFGGRPDDAVAVPNYFGQQRFGSRRPVTHEVGLAIVRGSWENAVLAYVGNPHEREPVETRAARDFVDETHDWRGALERFPDHLGFERAMLHRLAEGDDRPADFRAALETAPTSLQQLFVNAAQAYAFNLILSERLERGLPFHEPVPGDLVCFAETHDEGLVVPDADRDQRVTADRLETVRRHSQRGRAFVTAPLVGAETAFADGEPGEIERAVCDDLDLAPEDFALPGEFHSDGTRRAVLVRTDLAVGEDPLTLSFALPKGSYATVLLREYLKVEPGDL